MPLHYSDLFGVNIRYIEYLLSKSLLSHQYIHNIPQSGSEVETEIRELFKALIPERFKVTHGYIVYAQDQAHEPLISPQVDMIIVDTLVPHSLFKIDKHNGMEVVPQESVVGIFELKRTLNIDSTIDAMTHIRNIVTSVAIRKDNPDRFLPGGIQFSSTATVQITGGFPGNPILGVIGLDYDNNIINQGHANFLGTRLNQFAPNHVDFVCGLRGFFMGLSDVQNVNSFQMQNVRTPDLGAAYQLRDTSNGQSQARIIGLVFGYLLSYIQNTAGRVPTLSNYFFNNTLNV